jgi:uncharacterized Zn-finger protein
MPATVPATSAMNPTESPAAPQTDPHAVVELAASELMGPGVTHCPNPRMPLWNQHPRVFLNMTGSGDVRCPYCGTVYRMKAGEHAGGGH